MQYVVLDFLFCNIVKVLFYLLLFTAIFPVRVPVTVVVSGDLRDFVAVKRLHYPKRSSNCFK